MTLSIAAASYLYQASPPVGTSNPDQPQSDWQPATAVAASLAPATVAGLPRIQMPSDMLAAIQSGSGLHAPDPQRTAAQDSTPAYSLIKDAGTGQILGGVWPGAGVVSKLNIPIDNRITGNSDWSQVTQYLAQDITQGTGKPVTVQYFEPGDPNAPTFGSVMG